MKVFIMVVLLALSASTYMADKGVPETIIDGTCQCAAFRDESKGKGEPIISKTPGFKVPCTPEGDDNCRKMCMALAEASKDKIPQIICDQTIHIEGLMPAGYYKSCDAPEWSYTGITSLDPICCHKGKLTECKPH